MAAKASALMSLMRVIAAGDAQKALQLLAFTPELATEQLAEGASRERSVDFFLTDISHYAYAGDTALHIAAAAHDVDVARALVAAGAAVTIRNRRGAEPLHYAADSRPGSDSWNPQAQAATITYLISAGADPNTTDGSKVRPLHRAVRTRGAAAVRALLDGGADPLLANGNGSTAIELATRQTGRSGSGSPQAKAQQAEIVGLFERYAVT